MRKWTATLDENNVGVFEIYFVISVLNGDIILDLQEYVFV